MTVLPVLEILGQAMPVNAQPYSHLCSGLPIGGPAAYFPWGPTYRGAGFKLYM